MNRVWVRSIVQRGAGAVPATRTLRAKSSVLHLFRQIVRIAEQAGQVGGKAAKRTYGALPAGKGVRKVQQREEVQYAIRNLTNGKTQGRFVNCFGETP